MMYKESKLVKTIFSRIIRGSNAFFDIAHACFSAQTVPKKDGPKMTIINKIALAIAIVGTLNWGLVGLFSFDLVAWISGGMHTVLARIIYVTVALAGVWCISMLFRDEDEVLESGV